MSSKSILLQPVGKDVSIVSEQNLIGTRAYRVPLVVGSFPVFKVPYSPTGIHVCVLRNTTSLKELQTFAGTSKLRILLVGTLSQEKAVYCQLVR